MQPGLAASISAGQHDRRRGDGGGWTDHRIERGRDTLARPDRAGSLVAPQRWTIIGEIPRVCRRREPPRARLPPLPPPSPNPPASPRAASPPPTAPPFLWGLFP